MVLFRSIPFQVYHYPTPNYEKLFVYLTLVYPTDVGYTIYALPFGSRSRTIKTLTLIRLALIMMAIDERFISGSQLQVHRDWISD